MHHSSVKYILELCDDPQVYEASIDHEEVDGKTDITIRARHQAEYERGEDCEYGYEGYLRTRHIPQRVIDAVENLCSRLNCHQKEA
tara:strand:- start:612 stop:869 length:258 start_codon:yes stop_codon:yes gene_type:complete